MYAFRRAESSEASTHASTTRLKRPPCRSLAKTAVAHGRRLGVPEGGGSSPTRNRPLWAYTQYHLLCNAIRSPHRMGLDTICQSPEYVSASPAFVTRWASQTCPSPLATARGCRRGGAPPPPPPLPRAFDPATICLSQIDTLANGMHNQQYLHQTVMPAPPPPRSRLPGLP